MKTYNQSNFFKHTFCEFQEIDRFEFPEDTNYKSKSKSMYFYTDEGVYRKSNHWGRVANCRWKLVTDSKYKNQKIALIGCGYWGTILAKTLTELKFKNIYIYDSNINNSQTLKKSLKIVKNKI